MYDKLKQGLLAQATGGVLPPDLIVGQNNGISLRSLTPSTVPAGVSIARDTSENGVAYVNNLQDMITAWQSVYMQVPDTINRLEIPTPYTNGTDTDTTSVIKINSTLYTQSMTISLQAMRTMPADVLQYLINRLDKALTIKTMCDNNAAALFALYPLRIDLTGYSMNTLTVAIERGIINQIQAIINTANVGSTLDINHMMLLTNNKNWNLFEGHTELASTHQMSIGRQLNIPLWFFPTTSAYTVTQLAYMIFPQTGICCQFGDNTLITSPVSDTGNVTLTLCKKVGFGSTLSV